MKQPFEGDSFLAEEIIRLTVDHHIRTVIETGTETGVTSNAFASMVQAVYTIDTEPQFDHLKSNVVFLHGDSRFLLEDAICAAIKPVLFYLDAHTQDFESDCPLPVELSIIPVHTTDPVIVIHDALVPGHPELGWSKYKNGAIAFAMIAHLLPPIYPHGYLYRYNRDATGARRGVLFIEPSSFAKATADKRETGNGRAYTVPD